jgi:hypothetical protein
VDDLEYRSALAQELAKLASVSLAIDADQRGRKHETKEASTARPKVPAKSFAHLFLRDVSLHECRFSLGPVHPLAVGRLLHEDVDLVHFRRPMFRTRQNAISHEALGGQDPSSSTRTRRGLGRGSVRVMERTHNGKRKNSGCHAADGWFPLWVARLSDCVDTQAGLHACWWQERRVPCRMVNWRQQRTRRPGTKPRRDTRLHLQTASPARNSRAFRGAARQAARVDTLELIARRYSVRA